MDKKKDKFKKNDKFMYIAYIIITVAFGVLGGVALIYGIYATVKIGTIYLLRTLLILLGFGFGWIIFRLFISFLCDVKLIRDKLYNTESEELKEFYSDNKEAQNKQIKTEKSNEHYQSGEISGEEHRKS